MLILASGQEAVNNTMLLQNNTVYSKEQSKKQTVMMGTEVEQRSEEQYQGWQSAINILWHPEPCSTIKSLSPVNTEMIGYQRYNIFGVKQTGRLEQALEASSGLLWSAHHFSSSQRCLPLTGISLSYHAAQLYHEAGG